jgi:hypothetical protein
MFGFGKPKAVKGLGKARDKAEKGKVALALYDKYPQMYKSDWSKPKPKAKTGVVAAVKRQRKQEKSALEGALTDAEIKRLQGSK